MQALTTRCTWLYIEVIIVGFQPPPTTNPPSSSFPSPSSSSSSSPSSSVLIAPLAFFSSSAFRGWGLGGGSRPLAAVLQKVTSVFRFFLFSPVLSLLPHTLRPSPAGVSAEPRGLMMREEKIETVPVHIIRPTHPTPD